MAATSSSVSVRGERQDGELPEIHPLAAHHLQQEVERFLEALDAEMR
jgi:hypothetical protein